MAIAVWIVVTTLVKISGKKMVTEEFDNVDVEQEYEFMTNAPQKKAKAIHKSIPNEYQKYLKNLPNVTVTEEFDNVLAEETESAQPGFDMPQFDNSSGFASFSNF
jgi:hypothetical protein